MMPPHIMENTQVRPLTLQKIHKPTPNVEAGRGGAILVPEPMDVLSGRGGAVNSHPGNRRYRDLVTFMKAEYLNESTRKNEKTHISANIVWTIRNGTFPGRFLKQDPKTKLWHEIGDKAAFRKTGQALRENSAEFLRSKEEEQSASTNAMRSIWNQHLSFPSD